jgi:hypothetical protein
VLLDAVVAGNHDSIDLGDVIGRKPQLLYASGPYFNRKYYSGIVTGDIIIETISSCKN